MKIGSITISLVLTISATFIQSCGYDAADADDLEAREGEIVGVFVKSNGKSQPDSTIEIYEQFGETALFSSTGINSDGSFGVFPPNDGFYNVVGIVGDLDKAIYQNIEFKRGEGLNIGTIMAQRVGGLSVKVTVPESFTADGVDVTVLGFEASTTTIDDGVGLIESGIPAGSYSVKFSKTGLQEKVVENVEISSTQITVLQDVNIVE